MNKLHWKNPENLKTNLDQLIGFKGEEKLVHSSTQDEDQNLKLLKMPSKYATILTCSFEKDPKMVLGGKLLP